MHKSLYNISMGGGGALAPPHLPMPAGAHGAVITSQHVF